MNVQPALSVLIPNYNYARYIGETIESVLGQGRHDLEIVVTDNASTDDSVEVVKRFTDERIRLSVNAFNVGFSANLERVASLARGRRMLLLSSDDKMNSGALEAYERLERALGATADAAVWGAATAVIDAHGNITDQLAPDPKFWSDAVRDEQLSRAVGYPVLAMPATGMLRRSLELLRTPLPFATTCYPRALHDQVGGYAGGRLINPDKWFLWKLMSVAEMIYVIDHPLFAYRVHEAGQGPQQQRSGALKHLSDQYAATFSLPDSVLQRAGLDRAALARSFVEQDIALRGLVALSEGQRVNARRTVHFALAAYPEQARRNAKVWLLRALVQLGPLGTELARLARGRAQRRWQARQAKRSDG